MRTPWGKADNVEEVLPGVTWVSTPGHGGLRVTPEAHARMKEPWSRFESRFTPRGVDGVRWYEEDCEWAIVAMGLPGFIDAQPAERRSAIRESAESCIRTYYPDFAEELSPEGA